MPSSSLLGIWGDKQWLEWLNEERAHINRISLMGADSSGSKPTVTLATILAIGVSLSLDSMAVCIAAGIQTKPKIYQALMMAFTFGFFQGLMPLLGFLCGNGIQSLISSFDHWVAMAILGFVGGKMIYESVTELIEDCRERRREKEEAEAEEREEREAQMKGHDAKADLEKGARRKSGQKKALLSPLSPAGSSGTDSATSNASNSASSAAVPVLPIHAPQAAPSFASLSPPAPTASPSVQLELVPTTNSSIVPVASPSIDQSSVEVDLSNHKPAPMAAHPADEKNHLVFASVETAGETAGEKHTVEDKEKDAETGKQTEKETEGEKKKEGEQATAEKEEKKEEGKEGKEEGDDTEKKKEDPFSLKQLVLMGLATSIDAMAVGLSFTAFEVNVPLAFSLFFVCTFVLCIPSVFLGRYIGETFSKGANILGGVVLIVVGVNVVLSHMTDFSLY